MVLSRGSGQTGGTGKPWIGANVSGLNTRRCARTPGHGVSDNRRLAERAARTAAEPITGALLLQVLPAGVGQHVLNEKQQLAVDLVCEQAQMEIAFRQAVAQADARGGTRLEDDRGEPLRLVMSGTAGTGKTVAIREKLRRVGQSTFLVLAPTGNAACALSRASEVAINFKAPQNRCFFLC